MPRTARKISSTGIYHVMIRGADGRTLFADDEDNHYFIKKLKSIKEEAGFRIFAYCLMGNHVHLLMKEEKETVGESIKRLGSSYVYYYNRKYQLHGHLFQDRFRSERVEDDAYFLDVLRYICQNPVKAGLSRTPEEYPWLGCSGVRDVAGIVDHLGTLANMNDGDLRDFVRTPIAAEHLEDNGYRRMTDRDASAYLCGVTGFDNPQQIHSLDFEQKENTLADALSRGLSIRQLVRLTGISRNSIEKIAKSGKQALIVGQRDR